MKKQKDLAMLAITIFCTVIFATGFTVSSSINLHEGKKEAVSDQIWAVQVEAEPGEEGRLKQNFEAAHGPYDERVKEGTADEVKEDAYGIELDDIGSPTVVKGEDYVGDYFHIEQEASTTGGTTKRYIDISSQWSHGYVYEDMVVEGRAEIVETFSMDNLKPGEAISPEWHDLF